MVPPLIQLPLGDTIGIIADSDFYQGWLNLVPVGRRRRWLTLGSGRAIQYGGSRYDQRHVTNRAFCIQKMASQVPLRRVVFRNQIRSRPLLPTVPCLVSGLRSANVIDNSKSTS
jgi:hypothetical protein